MLGNGNELLSVMEMCGNGNNVHRSGRGRNAESHLHTPLLV